MNTLALDALYEREVIALARFVASHARLRTSGHWRASLARCARDGQFIPYLTGADERAQRRLVEHGRLRAILTLRTEALLARAGRILTAGPAMEGARSAAPAEPG